MGSKSTLIRAVLDTNQFISAAISPRGNSHQLLEAWRNQQFTLVISPSIVEEIRRAFTYPRLKKYLKITTADLQRLMDSLLTDALLVPGHADVPHGSVDRDDMKFLACALEGEASCIVTGDKKILDLREWKGIRIVTVKEFLAVLKK